MLGIPRGDLVWYGGALGVLVGLAIVFGTEPPPKPQAPALPPTLKWKILGDPIALRHGVRYRGCISVPWPASVAVSSSAVKSRAEKEGFLDVVVWTEQPSTWPDVDCKQYVEATWGGGARDLDKPGVVPFAWELTG